MVKFADLEIELPTAWLDISDDLPAGSPATLAREDGVGALQFSVYHYVAGEAPQITESTLREMLDQFCARNDLQIRPEPLKLAKNLAVGGAYRDDDEITAVWYISDGVSAAMVTYVASDSNKRQATDELRDAEAIVRSARFSRAI